jgi:hypothetical protein
MIVALVFAVPSGAITTSTFAPLLLTRPAKINFPANVAREFLAGAKSAFQANMSGNLSQIVLASSVSAVSGTSPTITATLQTCVNPFAIQTPLDTAIAANATTVLIADTVAAPTAGEFIYLFEKGNPATGKDEEKFTGEWARVTSVSTSGGKHSLTVVRGVAGSTAAAFGTYARVAYTNGWSAVPSGLTSGTTTVTTGAVSATSGAAVNLNTVALDMPSDKPIAGNYFRMLYTAGGTSPSVTLAGTISAGSIG